jgi:ArsR family transcriptional regulator, arsenate/arsenite/antimonite-responsive transcriptional repressor
VKHLDDRDRAELLRVLAHPTRLAVLEELSKGTRCVSDIQDLLNVPQPNISQHLTVLRRERLVSYFIDGKLRCYYLTRPSLVNALLAFLDGDYATEHRSREDICQTNEHAPGVS